MYLVSKTPKVFALYGVSKKYRSASIFILNELRYPYYTSTKPIRGLLFMIFMRDENVFPVFEKGVKAIT